MIRRKEKLVKDEEWKKKWEEEERAKRAALPNPNQDKIELSSTLADYLTKLLRDHDKE